MPKASIECPICTETFEDDLVALQPCGHVYCRGCVILFPSKSRNQRDKECPMCRQKLEGELALYLNLAVKSSPVKASKIIEETRLDIVRNMRSIPPNSSSEDLRAVFSNLLERRALIRNHASGEANESLEELARDITSVADYVQKALNHTVAFEGQSKKYKALKLKLQELSAAHDQEKQAYETSIHNATIQLSIQQNELQTNQSRVAEYKARADRATKLQKEQAKSVESIQKELVEKKEELSRSKNDQQHFQRQLNALSLSEKKHKAQIRDLKTELEQLKKQKAPKNVVPKTNRVERSKYPVDTTTIDLCDTSSPSKHELEFDSPLPLSFRKRPRDSDEDQYPTSILPPPKIKNNDAILGRAERLESLSFRSNGALKRKTTVQPLSIASNKPKKAPELSQKPEKPSQFQFQEAKLLSTGQKRRINAA